MKEGFNEMSGKYTKLLFPYAYNILGTTDDAKDAVQDVLEKYLSRANREIADEKNYLIRSVINTAINLKNRQKRILHGEGVWLPEPVATDDTADRNLYLNEVLSYSLLVLMERLSAKERAVFILKETFDYSHEEIADTIGITEEYSRKLFSRAKAGLFKPALKPAVEQQEHEREVLMKLMSAIRRRDTNELEMAMADDVKYYADGGGKVPLLATTSTGAVEVTALFITAYYRFLTSAQIEYARINHQPAILCYLKGHLTSCQVFDLHPQTGIVLQVHSILDPNKLKALSEDLHISNQS
jgi:RNA polymerase sigma factor (sigma-70 family)